MHDPSYTAALDRLTRFLPDAGRNYAARRNYDDRGGVSVLSRYIRHRIITEEDVLRATLARHSRQAAEKFVQEVFWRTYWKGWLELRPTVWTSYQSDLRAALNRVQTESGLRQAWEVACKGETGIDCFDHWARELAATGYLHNHARMWFASIWIFTLRLPWALGADFFLRHLIDGDPASNTLSWRWVGGLQTQGKTYLARADNIEKYTQGRFRPNGLATHATALDGPPIPTPGTVPQSDAMDTTKRTGLLLTEEDLAPGWLLNRITPVATAIVRTTAQRSPLAVSPLVTDFVSAAMTDCTQRFNDRLGPVAQISPDSINQWAADHELEQVVTAYTPTGPTAEALRGTLLQHIIRPYDSAAWPHATHGFFRFKDQIPKLLSNIVG